MKKDIYTLRLQTAQYAVEYVTGRGEQRDFTRLRDSFNELCEAICPDPKETCNSDYDYTKHRNHVSFRVATDCIHVLSSENMYKLGQVLAILEKNPHVEEIEISERAVPLYGEGTTTR